MKTFEEIEARAQKRKGGKVALAELMPQGIVSVKTLAKRADEFYLGELSKSVFKAGFVWKVIDRKWPDFETAFWQFNVRRCAAMSPEDIDAHCQNTAIVRNLKKIQTVQHNAMAVLDIAGEYGSFGKYLAAWDERDFVSLVNDLKKRTQRLGLQTCQYFCRAVGKDGFVLSADVVAALIDAGVIDKAPTSRQALQNVQHAFNQWREESGLNLAQISRTLACSIDAP